MEKELQHTPDQSEAQNFDSSSPEPKLSSEEKMAIIEQYMAMYREPENITRICYEIALKHIGDTSHSQSS